MSLSSAAVPVGAAGPAASLPSPDVLRARAVHRAAAELRRGIPVIMDGLGVMAADTASAAGLAELRAITAEPPVLLLSPVRAAAVLRRPLEGDGIVALHTAGLDDLQVRRLADPTIAQPDPTPAQILPEPPQIAPVPHGAEAALALARIARVLPAMLVAPLRPGATAPALQAVPGADVLAHPELEAGALRRVADTLVPLEDAPDARVVAFRAPDSGVEHLAIVIGDPATADAPLIRIHSECFTGDLLGSMRCDCGPQLRQSIRRIAEAGHGAVLYLSQEGRGLGLVNKLRAYALQDHGLDTLDANRALGWSADDRSFRAAVVMLGELGITRLRLLTNNPGKVAALAASGIEVVSREKLVIPPNGIDDHYLATKRKRFGHDL